MNEPYDSIAVILLLLIFGLMGAMATYSLYVTLSRLSK